MENHCERQGDQYLIKLRLFFFIKKQISWFISQRPPKIYRELGSRFTVLPGQAYCNYEILFYNYVSLLIVRAFNFNLRYYENADHVSSNLRNA